MLELIKVKTHAVTVELYKFVQMTRFYNMNFFSGILQHTHKSCGEVFSVSRIQFLLRLLQF